MPQFTPPTELVNAYLNRPSPGQEISNTINQAFQGYVQQKQAEHKAKNEALQTLLKASDSVDLSDPNTAKAFAPLYKDAGVDPSIFQPPTPSTATAQSPQVMQPQTAGTPDEQGQPVTSPISPIVQAHLAAGAPDHAGIMASVGDPNQLIKTGFGRKKIAAAESVQKLADAQATAADKAEENGPKSFDYARAFAKNAGTPNAAEGFIQLAQKEGRSTLSKRELDDMKNSINVSAQQGRGQYFGTQAALNQQKFNNQLLQEGNKALNPNIAGGTLKPQQERLNRIGRAEALINQMQTQAGGGDTRQMRELATSLASVLTGGNVVAEQQINELIPQTYKGNANRFYEKLTNNPTGLEQQAFVNRLADTIKREKGTITQQIGSAQQAALPSLAVLKQTNPKAYQQIIDANMTQGGGSQPTGPHGASITQNGHTYNWNGTTYE